MKRTASTVILNIENVLEKCQSVNETQLIGFNPEQSRLPAVQRKADKAELFSVYLQVKVLSQLPEIIWKHLDNDEFFVATQLFIFARHINTGLRLNKTTSSNGTPIIQQFPLVKNYWAILQQFFGTIKDRCKSRLEAEDLVQEVAAKCLASLILLESPGIDKLLDNLMNQRLKAFCNVLDDNTTKFSVVRDKLLASLNVLRNTVLLLHRCFTSSPLNNHKSLLAEQLDSLCSDSAPYTISYVPNIHKNPQFMEFLPDIICKYRPTVSVSEVPLQSVQTALQQWMIRLQEISSTHIQTLVNLIGSVKVIREIKGTSFDSESVGDWNQICTELQLPKNLNFYRLYYHTLINDRVKQIIQCSWTETQQSLKEDIQKWVESNTNHNMQKFMWTEEQADIPMSLGQAQDADLKQRKLLMKSQGFVPEILTICTHFDRNLEALYKDVDNYLANVGDVHSSRSEEVRQDQGDLVGFLVNATTKAIEELAESFKNDPKIQDRESFLQMARVYQAIRELCPHLRLLVCYRLNGMSFTGNDQWTAIAQLLTTESINYWMRFADQYFAEWCVSYSSSRPLTDYHHVLEEFTAWQSVTIVEKDEEENSVQSTIRIPAQPSIRLQTTLFRVATDLNKIAPQTIPLQVVGHLMERITRELLKYYDTSNDQQIVADYQNVSLQFYFDIKYLSLMLINREIQDKTLAEYAQKLANQFKSQVDPFDFELFYVHLTRNVKTAVNRTLQSLGVIIPNMEQLAAVLEGGEKPVTSDREPNVLALSGTTVSWFPLLPIANPVKMDSSPAVQKEDTVRHQSPDNYQ